MIRNLLFIAVLPFLFTGCQDKEPPPEKNDFEATLMTLDPGHFHSGLVQKNMYPEVNPVAYVYAPEGDEVKQHLAMIDQYNNRPDSPTQWKEEVYTGADFAEKMFAEKPGNVMVVAGNNQKKTDYILQAVQNDIHVYSDKPMAINGENYEKLRQAFDTAEENDLLIYDIMTERYEITTILQRELSTFPSIFGEVAESTPDHPAITKESVHHFSKIVSGSPLIRPAWFFDVEQQGSGIVDVSTHLVDLIMWSLFPEENLQPSDSEITLAKQWPTKLSLSEFEKVTGLSAYPDYLAKDVEGDELEVFANGEIIFRLKDIYGKASVIWDYEAPEGGQDTHYSIFRGTRSDLVIRQDESTHYEPELYVEPSGSFDREEWRENMQKTIDEIVKEYPGLTFEDTEEGFRIDIPDRYKVGHEAHFTQVTEKFLEYLKAGKIPDWEKNYMLTKYYITTGAYEKSKE